MNILLTGGTGYIGSHTCVHLLEQGHDAVIMDNLSNSSAESVDRIQSITGRRPKFIKGDLRDRDAMDDLFSSCRIDAVIHFAGLKSVAESVRIPLLYYANNITATVVLLETMNTHGLKTLVFSSSATVYGEPQKVPITEDAPLNPVNPYGRTKRIIEDILRDLHASDPDWSIAILRYFNPVGAHPSGKIGEIPSGIPNNLMPYACKVATGELPELYVYGNDYPTPDGTGIRDYIHVMDLAKGHLRALEKITAARGLLTCNLGTGRGYSVLEMVAGLEKACKNRIPYKITGRRPGDVPVCFADPSLSGRLLNWKAALDIDRMCADAWRWQCTLRGL